VIDFDYAARQLAGVWKMAWNRPDWTMSLDRSVDGVFRSFWAVALAAPFALAEFVSLRRILSRDRDNPIPQLVEAPLGYAVAVEAVAYLLGWSAGLAALVMAARALGASRRAGDAIIGFNWVQVMTAAAQAAMLALAVIAGDSDASILFRLPIAVFAIALIWGVLRRSLGAGVAATIAVFLMIVVVGGVARLAIELAAIAVLHAFA